MRPSLGQVKWFALLFAAFFAATTAAQYVFVTHEADSTIQAELEVKVDEIIKRVGYRDGVDPAAYFKVDYPQSDFVIVLGDGSVLETWLAAQHPLRNALPRVRCPVLSDTAFREPTAVTYRSDTILPEHWTVMARKLAGGTLIAGISALQEVPDAKGKLADNLELFGETAEEATLVNRSKLENTLEWAVISDDGRLLGADGRLPLKTDAMQIGQMSNGERRISSGGRRELVAYRQLLDASRQPVGTIILFKDITLQESAVASQARFGIAVAAASFIAFLALAAYYAARQEGEKQAIRQSFQHYFSPQIMDAILREPEKLRLGGQRREVTILFSDIRSFTSLTEQLPPQELSRLLREYFDAMTEEVFATDGIVDKYIGDAIMAFWGAPIEQPDQADRAVRTAIGMVKRLRQLQEKWKAEGMPVLEAGIGINLGIATVGNLGSTKRFDYTLVGDAVNAASRIEQLNKEYRSHIIISGTTREQLTMPVSTKDLGEVQVRGKDKPVRIYEVEVGGAET